MASATFYGDFNCPFCYAENERLIRMGIEASVGFKGIEHAPELRADGWDLDDAKALDTVKGDLERLRDRAPDVEVAHPPGMPNTKRALLALAEATLVDASKAPQLRTNLFRALWQDEKDISTDEVVDAAWSAAGLGDRPNPPSREARRLAKVWTVEWNNGPFERRIPVLATDEGQRLLGLAEPTAIDEFLSDFTKGGHNPDVCEG